MPLLAAATDKIRKMRTWGFSNRAHRKASMAAISSISVAPMAKTLHSNRTQKPLPISFLKSRAFSRPVLFSSKRLRIGVAQSSASVVEEENILEKDQRRSEEDEQEAMSIENLKQFVELNLGKWNGTFYQFDSHGNLMQKVNTKLSASSYGESELISLIQTLYIKQPQSNTSVSGDDPDAAAEWVEYKIKESNMFTVDKYQQISFFHIEKAFSLRYQTAGMLESILRQGVLGEDDTGEESPKNLKLPSRKPSIVCENCLYSMEKDMRTRAFHILDPKGVLEMLLVFLEERDGLPFPPSLANSEDNGSRIAPFLGRWKGHSITKRSGVYGATIAEAEIDALLELDDKGQVIQDITSTVSGTDITTNVHWTGTVSDNLVTFDGGFQMTLLPGGIYMACPCDVSKNVNDENAFHLEFCWMESPGKRQKLIRTYDLDGMAVSSTYISESKV